MHCYYILYTSREGYHVTQTALSSGNCGDVYHLEPHEYLKLQNKSLHSNLILKDINVFFSIKVR